MHVTPADLLDPPQLGALAGVFVLGLGAVFVTRLIPPRVGLALWAAVPIVGLVKFVENAREHDWTLFNWIKLYSVVVAGVWLMICRVWPGRAPALRVGLVAYLLMQMNVGEAVAKDLKAGNWVGLAAGLLLLVATPLWKTARVEETAPNDFRYDFGAPWIAAYTAWQLSFIYAQFGLMVFVQHAVISAAALLAVLKSGSDTWYQARVYSFGVYLVVYHGAYTHFISWFPKNGPDPVLHPGAAPLVYTDPTAAATLTWIALFGAAWAALTHVRTWRWFRGRAGGQPSPG